ncbi:MAG: TRAP transporter fused permease subunit [Betaproteobacteria bacterium]|nr:TRAP transporter fused permease subunit [Betaproteobacteria bacterium]
MSAERPTAAGWLAAATAVYHLAVVAQLPTWLGVFIPMQVHQAVSVCCAMLLLFLFVRPSRPRQAETLARGRIRWRRAIDFGLLAAGLIGGGFVIVFYDRMLDYSLRGFLDAPGIVLALLLAAALLEGVRRVAGLVLPIIIVSIVLATMLQPILPGVLSGIGFPIERILYSMYVGDAGIFGLPLNVAANIVIVYMIFGALMHHAGASQWFMNLALAVTGRSRGGPAKAAVLGSALFGSISGSPSGNSATTGVFTIPMMKSIGYTARFAAAVEAVASTGGMILPPVMGAIAFLMAEWIGVPYIEVALAATVPALLYFGIVFLSVHLQAKKDDVRAIDQADLPRLGPSLVDGWQHMLPMAALFYFLIVAGLSPGIAGAYASAVVVAASFLGKARENRLTPMKLIKAFDDGVGRWAAIAVITAAIGMMIGSLELSGVGIKFSRFIIDLAGGNLIMTMLLVGIASLIVGMGLDATPAYVTLATLMAPALIRLGVPDIAAHLFVIYWGLASFYTPPTCIALFVTCGISGSRIWETGWEAVRLGIAAFIVPFAFILNPGLLLRGSVQTIALAVLAAGAAAILLAAATRGFAFRPLKPIERGLLLAAACLLIVPSPYPTAIGTLLGGTALASNKLRKG